MIGVASAAEPQMNMLARTQASASEPVDITKRFFDVGGVIIVTPSLETLARSTTPNYLVTFGLEFFQSSKP